MLLACCGLSIGALWQVGRPAEAGPSYPVQAQPFLEWLREADEESEEEGSEEEEEDEEDE